MLARFVGRQQPGPHLILDPGVIDRHPLDGAVTPPVDSRVADVRERRGGAVDDQRGGGGRHAPQILAAGHFLREPLVGDVKGALQPVAVDAEGDVEGLGPGAGGVRVHGLGDIALDRLDDDARGDFAGHVAAHSVGHYEETEVRAGAVAVLVGQAPDARMRTRGPLHTHDDSLLRTMAIVNDGWRRRARRP